MPYEWRSHSFHILSSLTVPLMQMVSSYLLPLHFSYTLSISYLHLTYGKAWAKSCHSLGKALLAPYLSRRRVVLKLCLSYSIAHVTDK